METELLKYGYLFIFLGTLVEGDATLLTAAFLAHRGYFRLPWVMAVAFLASVIASHAYFLVARHNGAKLLDMAKNRGAKVEWIISWSSRRGGLLLIASRFMFGLRTLIPIVCGATGMRPGRFVLWNSVSAIIWAVSFGVAGYLGGQLSTVLVADIRRHEKALAAILAIAVAGFVLWRTHGRELRDIWLLRRLASKR